MERESERQTQRKRDGERERDRDLGLLLPVCQYTSRNGFWQALGQRGKV